MTQQYAKTETATLWYAEAASRHLMSKMRLMLIDNQWDQDVQDLAENVIGQCQGKCTTSRSNGSTGQNGSARIVARTSCMTQKINTLKHASSTFAGSLIVQRILSNSIIVTSLLTTTQQSALRLNLPAWSAVVRKLEEILRTITASIL